MVWGLISLLSAVAPGSTANDAYWSYFGGAGAFSSHDTIRMLGEDVNISLTDKTVHVRVWFSFENAGPETSVEMAFPFSSVAWAEPPIIRFSTKVDGQTVDVKKVKTDSVEEGVPWEISFVYVKTVKFAKGQRRTVMVDYVTRRYPMSGGFMFDRYILKSGATWAGNIGHISITVDWSGAKESSPPDLVFRSKERGVVPSDWTYFTPTKATTSLTNVEPDFDLSLASLESFWNVWVNGERLTAGYGIHEAGMPYLYNGPQDPNIPIGALNTLLYDWFEAQGLPRNEYGGFFSVTEHGLTFFKGKTIPLLGNTDPLEERTVMKLKDLISALGGTMQWDDEHSRIMIELPDWS